MRYHGHQDQRWGHISYAQHGDDFFILNCFDLMGIQRPSYLDIGAHHPQTISNTALLYERGCRGINVEANPNLIANFRKLRPEDLTLNIGVAPQRGKLPFYMYHQESGRNTFSSEEMTSFTSQYPEHPVRDILYIEVMTINDVVEGTGGFFPDLLTMDIEGLDYDVLKSADFSRSAPKLICVETRREDGEKMRSMMKEKGYAFVARVTENLFFCRNDLAHHLL